MHLSRIRDVLNCEVLCCEDQMDLGVISVMASDMMSDVLAYLSEMPISKDLLLVTGLVNLQTIRTASLVEIPAILFARGKVPHEAIIENARENKIAVLTTELTSFTVCGILYANGLQGIDEEVRKTDPRYTGVDGEEA